jgi:predicted O-methyltransferase YrrM
MNNVILSREELFRTGGHCDLTVPEMRTIAAFVMNNERKFENNKYLEIGVFGGGTMKFVKDCALKTHFTGIDLFEDYNASDANTHHPGTYKCSDVLEMLGDRVNLIKGDSDNVLPTMNEKFHFIFIDGNHKYDATLRDFNNAKNLLATGGQISFHNCSSFMDPDFNLYNKVDGGPWRVALELVKSGEITLIQQADRLGVYRLNA